MSRLSIENEKKYPNILCWDLKFYLTDDNGNELTNQDGSVAIFNCKDYNHSYLADGLEHYHLEHQTPDEFKVRISHYPITIESSLPVYLCTWDNDLIEIHTRNSLYDKYNDTNLYDDDESHTWILDNEPGIDDNGRHVTLNVLLDKISSSNEWISNIFTCDNMTIQRIK
jgi:hypothetical protein